MLTIILPETESYDEAKNEFVTLDGTTLELEHSLVSLSKWESKWERPFLGSDKTTEQSLDYIRCMTLTPEVDPNTYLVLSDEHITQVSTYIEAKMTATWFAETPNKPGGRDIITAELIYYWMIALTIPFECQDWHLNRLLTLVRVCNQKNAPEKKRSKAEMIAHRRALNESRQQQLKTTG